MTSISTGTTAHNFDWKTLQGKFISILITGKEGKKETYMGEVESVSSFIVLKTLPNPKFPIEKFVIRKDCIESIWIYKENKKP